MLSMKAETNSWRRRGQALLMVTVCLIAMCGVLGLAVDLGYSFFVRHTARSAADAAALAAVRKAISTAGVNGPYTCATNGITCSPVPLTCPASPSGSTNLVVGCQYAVANGFYEGGGGGAQSVSLTSDVSSPFNTATGPIAVNYWVRADVQQRVPQLFSAVLGNPTTIVRATATAAIVQVNIPESLVLLNRQYDKTTMTLGGGENDDDEGGSAQYGLNLWVDASDAGSVKALQTRGGIRLSSECGDTTLRGSELCSFGNGSGGGRGGEEDGGGGGPWLSAGVINGNGNVQSSETRIRLNGTVETRNGTGRWTPPPTNGTSNGFGDPMDGKTQPMLPNLSNKSLPLIAVPGGIINSSICSQVCAPGRYFATRSRNCGNSVIQQATGDPLQISGNIQFKDQSGFGSYVFYGGVRSGSGNGNRATFGPGVYVFAGVKQQNGESPRPGNLIDTTSNLGLLDETLGTGPNTNAGELFILTNGTYSGNINPPTGEPGVGPAGSCMPIEWPLNLEQQLSFGPTNLGSRGGEGEGGSISLHGLNPVLVGADLKPYAPTLIWQDRNNSVIKQLDNLGHVDTSCGSLNQPCHNISPIDIWKNPSSTVLRLRRSSSGTNLYGTIYQPRGAWTEIGGRSGDSDDDDEGGGGIIAGALQIISGAVHVRSNARLDLTAPQNLITINIATLIE